MISFSEFSNLHHAITLFGMSGIGKTILSTELRSSDNWFHYSADYRIGTRYLSEHILDNVKFKIMQMDDPFVADLLMSDSIYINHNISVDNLSPVSTFLGMFGDPKQGGLDKGNFLARQDLYRQAEIASMHDVKHFIQKSWQIYRCKNFVNDASGSLCELIDPKNLNDKLLNDLISQTLILYIEADEIAEKKLIERAFTHPKPLFYGRKFISDALKNSPYDGKKISPTEFAQKQFPHLLNYRKPKYNNIGNKFGFKISVNDLFGDSKGKINIPNSNNFLKRVYNAIDFKLATSNSAADRFNRYLASCTERLNNRA